MPTVAILVQL